MSLISFTCLLIFPKADPKKNIILRIRQKRIVVSNMIELSGKQQPIKPQACRQLSVQCVSFKLKMESRSETVLEEREDKG